METHRALQMRALKPTRLSHALPARLNTLVIDWDVGNRCNYACSYCPVHLHDSSIWKQQEGEARLFVFNMHTRAAKTGQQLHFQWTGGEPTLCKWLPSVGTYATS